MAQQVGDRTDWFLADHLGSTRALINDSGVIQRSFTYDAFGKLVGESGNAGVDTRYRFTGREWDGESQQYYYRARYYDANTGRFIGQDPLGFAAGDSNLYRYVGNSPAMATDPSGLFLEGAQRLIQGTQRLVQNTADTVKYGIKGTIDFYRNGGDVSDAVSSIRPTIMAQAATARDHYVSRFNDSSASPLEKLGAGVGGSLASLATAENYDKTATVLGWAMFADFGIQLGKAAPDILKGCGRLLLATGKLSDDLGRGAGNALRTVRQWGDDLARGTGKPLSTCFVAGTLVLTPHGEKPIEELRVGEFVVASDPILGITGNRRVKQRFEHKTDTVLHIQVDDTTIVCTPEHPFWVPTYGWQVARTLEVGTQLLTREGEIVYVNLIEPETGKFSVYNIEVEELHTYHVTNIGILVHNTCKISPEDLPGGPRRLDQELIDLNKALASQEQMGEAGVTIAGRGSRGNVPLRDSPRLAREYGGNPGDWLKKSSSSYKAADGTHVETHWYENFQTGQQVEHKIKVIP
ncbi:MAG: hypothetical protein B0A82_25575 [Alkalinema sp. CACIAM 70d]|nr:MAG: hypothetical protein B0A82_25575 [Alkalinema sp. CACIAM 70d]